MENKIKILMNRLTNKLQKQGMINIDVYYDKDKQWIFSFADDLRGTNSLQVSGDLEHIESYLNSRRAVINKQ